MIAQPTELFYRLKRGTLVASLVVILATLVGITIDNNAEVLFFKLSGAPTNIVPYVAEFLCLYYFFYFVVIFAGEAQNFRSEKYGLQSLESLAREVKENACVFDAGAKAIQTKLELLVPRIDDVLKKEENLLSPVAVSAPTSYQSIHDDAFNAISGAIRFAGGTNSAKETGLREGLLRQHIKWPDLANEIVKRLASRFENGAIARTVNSEVSKRVEIIKQSGEIQAAFGNLQTEAAELNANAATIVKRYAKLAAIVGFYRGAWWTRIWIFDLAIPVVVFLAAQAFVMFPQDWLVAVRHILRLV